MSKDSKRGGGAWFIIIMVLIIIGIVGVYLIWQGLGAAGYFSTPIEVRQTLQDLLTQNLKLIEEREDLEKDLAKAQSDAEGFPTGYFLFMIFMAIILAIVVILSSNAIGGRNINLPEAIKLSSEFIAQHYGWHRYDSGKDTTRLWKEVTPFTGQAVDGDGDAVWFVIQFSKDFLPTGMMAGGHHCITVLLKSNDADRQLNVLPGFNAFEAWEFHKFKLQRTAQPTDLNKELLEQGIETIKAVRAIQE